MSKSLWFTPEAIRQHVYCPRITYFRYVDETPVQMTIKMEKGVDDHERTLRGKNTSTRSNVIRYYNLRLENPYFRLYGLLDVMEVKDNEIYPVDRKTGKAPEHGVYRPHRFQLVAEAFLMEANFGRDVSKGVIEYRNARKRVIILSIKDKLEFINIINELRQIVSQEKLPKPTSHIRKCTDCEYWKKCRRI